MKTKQGILGIAALLLAAMFTLAGCGDADGGPTGSVFTYTYNTPASKTENGITATVSFNPVSPSSGSGYGLSVIATVSFTGMAAADGTMFVTLTSGKIHSTGAYFGRTLLVTGGQTTFTAQTLSFGVNSDLAVDDLDLTFSYAASENITIANNSDWTNAMTTIRNSDYKHYILTVSNDITVSGYSYHTPSFGAGRGLYVTVKGSSKLSLSSNGYLFYVTSGQTLIIDGPTLVGRNSNIEPLVKVWDGALQLISGSITGNTNTKDEEFNHGGGVYLVAYNPSFTMSGGTISGNTAISGGGVYVDDGIFTKSGGTIYGNSLDSYANVANNKTTNPVNTYGHAVYYRVYDWDVSHYDNYYRDTTLTTADSISTSQLPTSGTEHNWTKK
jgi:hypothetical protein